VASCTFRQIIIRFLIYATYASMINIGGFISNCSSVSLATGRPLDLDTLPIALPSPKSLVLFYTVPPCKRTNHQLRLRKRDISGFMRSRQLKLQCLTRLIPCMASQPHYKPLLHCSATSIPPPFLHQNAVEDHLHKAVLSPFRSAPGT
jgi:hypothetical protein